LLWPERFNVETLDNFKREMGSGAFNAQYQQHPSLPEGNIFKREWWRLYDRKPAEMAVEMETLWQSWDMAFKETKDSDFVVGQVWGLKGANRYLLDEVRGRMDFVGTKAAVRMLTEKWPAAKKKLVEDKANGPAIISELRNSIIGLIAVEPDGSKEARAYSVTPEIESGNVYLPSPANCSWIDDYIEELSAFPKGANDDRVDTTTQALRYAEKIKRQMNLGNIVSLTKSPAWVSDVT
jgi:predicted phage terminase large subunit-like protein